MAAQKSAATQLRAVEPGEKPKAPARPRAVKIATAAARDDDLAMYRSMKVAVARRLDNPKLNDTQFAAMSRRLMELTDLIRRLEGGGPDGGDDNPTAPDAVEAVDEAWDEAAL